MEKVRASRPCIMSESSNIRGIKKSKKFNLPLHESEIIQVHNILMTPEYQIIYTDNIFTGRQLMNVMLGSLGFYHHVGCLTSVRKFNHDVTNIFPILQKNAQVHGLEYAIDFFYVNYTMIDFIWIEMTDDLEAKLGRSNIEYFCNKLTQHQSIPVIELRYEE